MEHVSYIAKALLAAAIAFVGAVTTGYADNVMSAQEWWLSAGSALTALGVVFAVPNGDKPL